MSKKNGHADKGVSLARFPALVLGSILLTFGLLAFLADGNSPTDGFPDGTITDRESFLGFGVNDWTALFTAAAGGLLLFGAAQHLLARTMSLIVGLALGAMSVIALVDGDDVLGLAAANGWTKLGWGLAAIAALVNALLPRAGKKDKHKDEDHYREPVAAPRRDVETHREPVAPPRREVETHREPVSTHRETVETHPVRDEQITRVERVQDSRTDGIRSAGDRDGVDTRVDGREGFVDRQVDDRGRDDGSVSDRLR